MLALEQLGHTGSLGFTADMLKKLYGEVEREISAPLVTMKSGKMRLYKIHWLAESPALGLSPSLPWA